MVINDIEERNFEFLITYTEEIEIEDGIYLIVKYENGLKESILVEPEDLIPLVLAIKDLISWHNASLSKLPERQDLLEIYLDLLNNNDIDKVKIVIIEDNIKTYIFKI